MCRCRENKNVRSCFYSVFSQRTQRNYVLRSLSTINLLPQHVAIADMLLSDTTMSPTTTCCPRRHVSLADMLPSDTSMSPTTTCCHLKLLLNDGGGCCLQQVTKDSNCDID